MKIVILILLLAQNVILYSQQNNDWLSLDRQTSYIHEHIKVNNCSDFTFFLHGEIHSVSSNPQTKLDFLKYYYKEANVRNLVIEAGYASAYLLNLYLKTGNENYICKDFNFFSNENYRKFWEDLYLYNDSLTEKIKIIGIDDNESLLSWYKAIEVLFEHKIPLDFLNNNQLVRKVIITSKKTNGLTDLYREGVIDSLRSLKRDFIIDYNKSPSKYFEMLRNDSLHLRYIIENDVSINRTRHTNKNMYNNLHKLINESQVNMGSFFGQFGSAHVENHNRSLTHFLNNYEGSIFHNKVLTILPKYINCSVSDLVIDNGNVYTIISSLNSRVNKEITSLSFSSTYFLEELKNKSRNPNKYILYIKNKEGVRFDFPEVCD